MELTAEQRDLRDAVRGLLSRHQSGRPDAGPDGWRDSGKALWRRLCGEIGAAGLAIPERYGGAGAGPVETHIVLEELGRTLACPPLLGSAVLSGQALLASGDIVACERLLPAIADGTVVAALAWTGEAGHWNPRDVALAAEPASAAGQASPTGSASAAGQASPTGSASAAYGWALSGHAHHVLDGDVADVLLAAARTPGGIALFEVDVASGVARNAVTTMDATRRLAVVRLDGAPGRLIGSAAGPALTRARDLACIALSAEQIGAAQRALELTVAYTKVRVQFGRPIGSFQALQHRMADLHVLVESAR
jgi:alkylation response protein AidB-like acyl-CoA dehydrogenase